MHNKIKIKLMWFLYIITSLIFLGFLWYITFIKIDGYELYLLFTLPLNIFTLFFIIYGFYIIFSNFYLEDNKIKDKTLKSEEKWKFQKSNILLSNFYIIPIIVLISFICYLTMNMDWFASIWLLFILIISIISYIILTILIYLFTKNKVENINKETINNSEKNIKSKRKIVFYKKTKKVFIAFFIVVSFILYYGYFNLKLDKIIKESQLIEKEHSDFIDDLTINSNIDKLDKKDIKFE
jgi:preprotein translocase subunit SecG